MGMNLAMTAVTTHIDPNDVIISTQNIWILEKHCVYFTCRKPVNKFFFFFNNNLFHIFTHLHFEIHPGSGCFDNKS